MDEDQFDFIDVDDEDGAQKTEQDNELANFNLSDLNLDKEVLQTEDSPCKDQHSLSNSSVDIRIEDEKDGYVSPNMWRKEQVRVLTEENSGLRDQISNLQREMDEIRDRVYEEDAQEIVRLQTELTQKTREFRIVHFKWRKSQKELARTEADRDRISKELELRDSQECLLNSSETDDEMSTLRRQLDETEQDRNQLKVHVEQLKHEVEYLQSTSQSEDDVPTEKDNWKKYKLKKNKKNKEATNVSKLKEELSLSATRESDITEHLRKAEDHIEHLEGLIQFLEDDKVRLQSVLEKLIEQGTITKDYVNESCENTVDGLLKKMHALEDDNHHLYKELKDYKFDCDRLEDLLKETEGKLNADLELRDQEIESLKFQNEFIEKEKASLYDVIEEMRLKLEKPASPKSVDSGTQSSPMSEMSPTEYAAIINQHGSFEINEMKIEYEELRNIESSLKSKIESLQGDNDLLQMQLNEALNDIEKEKQLREDANRQKIVEIEQLKEQLKLAKSSLSDDSHLSPSSNTSVFTHHDGSSSDEHLLSPPPSAEPMSSIERMDRLINGKENDSPAFIQTHSTPRGISPRMLSEVENELKKKNIEYSELLEKYQSEKKEKNSEISDLEQIITTIENEKEHMENRLNFEKESCEFQFKLDKKNWSKEKKSLNDRIRELEERLEHQRPLDLSPKELKHVKTGSPKATPKVQTQDVSTHRSKPLMIPRALSLEDTPTSPNKDWSTEDFEHHTKRLQFDISKLEIDVSMYRSQTEELQCRVEQLSEDIANQKRAKDLAENEKEQIQLQLVKVLRERSDSNASFRAEKMQWMKERENLNARTENIREEYNREVNKYTDDIEKLTSKLRLSEMMQNKLRLELEKTLEAQMNSSDSKEANKNRRFDILDKSYMESRELVSALESQIEQQRMANEKLRRELKSRVEEAASFSEVKEQEVMKKVREFEERLQLEKESHIHELSECQAEIAEMRSKLAEGTGGDLAVKFRDWMMEECNAHERFRNKEAELRMELKNLQLAQSSLKEREKEWHEKEKILNDKITHLNNDLITLEQQREDRISTILQEKQNLSKEIETFIERLQTQKNENMRLMQQIEEQRKEMVELRMSQDILQDALRNREDNFQDVWQQAKERIINIIDIYKKQLNETILYYNSEMIALNHDISQTKAEVFLCENQVDTQKALVQEAQRSIEENKAQIMAFKRENRNKLEEIDKLKQHERKMEFELISKQQECTLVHQQLLEEQRRSAQLTSAHHKQITEIIVELETERRSKNVEFWENKDNFGNRSTTAMEEVIDEYKLLNQELVVSMQKTQEARKSEVGKLEEQLNTLRDENLKEKQSLLTKINELEDQLRNVDIVHSKLKTTLESCYKEQSIWKSEKLDLMKKIKDLNILVAANKKTIYNLEMEVQKSNRDAIVVDILDDKKGDNESVFDGDSQSEILGELDAMLRKAKTYAPKTTSSNLSTGGCLLSRMNSKRLIKTKSLDTSPDATPVIVNIESEKPTVTADEKSSTKNKSIISRYLKGGSKTLKEKKKYEPEAKHFSDYETQTVERKPRKKFLFPTFFRDKDNGYKSSESPYQLNELNESRLNKKKSCSLQDDLPLSKTMKSAELLSMPQSVLELREEDRNDEDDIKKRAYSSGELLNDLSSNQDTESTENLKKSKVGKIRSKFLRSRSRSADRSLSDFESDIEGSEKKWFFTWGRKKNKNKDKQDMSRHNYQLSEDDVFFKSSQKSHSSKTSSGDGIISQTAREVSEQLSVMIESSTESFNDKNSKSKSGSSDSKQSLNSEKSSKKSSKSSKVRERAASPMPKSQFSRSTKSVGVKTYPSSQSIQSTT